MAISEPRTLDFGDLGKFDLAEWEQFASDAQRFHAATRPGDELVVHKIETFRKFMSENAILRLGGLVRSHPRFHTTAGWDRWLQAVPQVLSGRKFAFLFFGQNKEFNSLADVLAEFRKGKLSIYRLWQALDELVVASKLSSREQREAFWNALEPKDQDCFASRNRAFDPADQTWEKDAPEEARRSEQVLSEVMEFSYVDEQIYWLRKFAIIGPLGVFLALLTQVLGQISLHLSDSVGAECIAPFFASAMLLFTGVRSTIRNRRALRKLELRQQELNGCGSER